MSTSPGGDITIDSLKFIQTRLEAAGGEDCDKAAGWIDGFLSVHEGKIPQDKAHRLLHSVWTLVSRALDVSSCDATHEPDICDLEASIAVTVGKFMESGGVT